MTNDKCANDKCANDKCENNQCSDLKECGYNLCKKCINTYITICTCNKEFIKGIPEYYALGKIDSVITLLKLPDPIPDFFYTPITGDTNPPLYQIFGCRGCQHKEEISVHNNFAAAIQASIVSCIFEKNDNNDYKYLSDSLDPVFDDYLQRVGIKIGDCVKVGDNCDNGGEEKVN
jgi:hypothetical protein